MPPWSKKDKRQYEHIKESQREQNIPETQAEEIAARTVNKRRRQEGRTPNTTTQGTGNPRQPLLQHTHAELYNQARELRIQKRSQMTKAELIKAISTQK
jgi:hypothetical protein